MKSLLLSALLLSLVAVSLAGDVIELDLEDIGVDLDGQPGQAVTGEFRWQTPEGEEVVVRYIADEDGYRVLDSNVVPRTGDGVFADGQQGDLDGASPEDYDDDDDK